MTITELSIKRPSLIIVIFAALISVGLFSYSKLKYELLPKFSPPILTVTTVYPGASPNEVETGVTKVIEDAVAGMDKVSEVRSSSLEGVSFVVIELLQSAKTDISLQDAQRKINEIITKLPTSAKTPIVTKFALDELPILRMGVTGDMNSRALYQFIKDRIQPQLSRIPGVGQVTLVGGDQREIKVNLDLQKIKSYGLSIMQITQSIKAANLDFPTGKIKDQDGQFIVRVAGKLSSIEELRKLPISISRQGGLIKLSDIAEVEDGIKEYSNILRLNFKSTIGLIVQKQNDANAVEVANLVKKELKAIEDQYATINKLKFEIAADGSLFTIDAANAVKEDLSIAVVLVAIVMLMFLHSVRNSFIVLIAIPASLISTFIAIYTFDFSLNLMTLLALSLVVGILVDDSIVVLENIYHYLEKGEDKKVAALKGRNEIGFAALAITFVDVSVFLPLALVGGIVGNILRQFAVVVVVSTLMSLFVSFTLTPLLASRFGKLERLTNATILGRFALWFEKEFHAFTDKYISLLKWSFVNRGKVWIITFVMFFSSIALVPIGLIGFEFMQQVDRGEFVLNVELKPGTPIEETNKISQRIEGILGKIPEVKKLYANVGNSSEGMIGFSTANYSEIMVTLVPKKERQTSTQEIKDYIKAQLAVIPGIKVRANEVGIFGTANETPIQILLTGASYEEVLATAKKVANVVKLIPGTGDVRLSSEDGNPETRITIDRNKMLSYGLTLAEVGGSLRVALTGDDESKLREGDTEYDIRVVLDQQDRSRTEELGNIPFMNRMGQQIYLKQFVTISRATGPTKLTRQARSASVIIYSQAIGRPSGSIANDFDKQMKNFPLPKGITYSYVGMVKNQKDSFADMMLALFAGILFTYMIMVALYDSFLYPFVILFSIPLAMIGALLALALAMKSLTIFSMLGVIMLVGLVGKNAILLVDRTNSMRAKGESLHDALIDAGKMRIRPIFMTTLTMIFGMMPIALSASEGSEWKSGLAWALIGGLTSSLFLTLIIVPLVYTKMEEIKVAFVPWIKKLTVKLIINKEPKTSVAEQDLGLSK
jgi:hydrophobic/amphiphilic exporter-1 (mainly G- bacteria), HAE1 family